MTSSTKPEEHNNALSRHRRTEPRPQVTCTKNVVKSERVVFETCERTDRHTDTLMAIPRTRPVNEVLTYRFSVSINCCTHFMVYSRVEEMGKFCSFLNKKCTNLYYMPDSEHALFNMAVDMRHTTRVISETNYVAYTYSRKRHNKLIYV